MDDNFGVFISHGGKSKVWQELARYIEKKLDIETYELSEQINKGRAVIEKLEDILCEKCDYAIVILTAEDELNDGTLRARQNVIHELGLCHGVLGREHILILRQKGVDIFSNISGLVYEEFEGDNIKSVFHKVIEHLEEALENWEDGDYEYGICEED